MDTPCCRTRRERSEEEAEEGEVEVGVCECGCVYRKLGLCAALHRWVGPRKIHPTENTFFEKMILPDVVWQNLLSSLPIPHFRRGSYRSVRGLRGGVTREGGKFKTIYEDCRGDLYSSSFPELHFLRVGHCKNWTDCPARNCEIVFKIRPHNLRTKQGTLSTREKNDSFEEAAVAKNNKRGDHETSRYDPCVQKAYQFLVNIITR